MSVVIATTPECSQAAAFVQRVGDRFIIACNAALKDAVSTGADVITEALQKAQLGIVSRGALSGLAGSVSGWMIDESAQMAAVGVPSNKPAYRYARIQNEGSGYLPGGVIRPVKAKMLAIPVSNEAKALASPRDQAGLQVVKIKGRLILAEVTGNKITTHWVLVPYVTIHPTWWFDNGTLLAKNPMIDRFNVRFFEEIGVN